MQHIDRRAEFMARAQLANYILKKYKDPETDRMRCELNLILTGLSDVNIDPVIVEPMLEKLESDQAKYIMEKEKR